MKNKIYLDYAATTPTDPRVVKAMMPYFTKNFANVFTILRSKFPFKHFVIY